MPEGKENGVTSYRAAPQSELLEALAARKLLGCPFCGGGDVELHPLHIATTGHAMPTQDGACVQYAHCNGCGAEGPQAFVIWEAIDAWNNRRAPDLLAALKEAETAMAATQVAFRARRELQFVKALDRPIREARAALSKAEGNAPEVAGPSTEREI